MSATPYDQQQEQQTDQQTQVGTFSWEIWSQAAEPPAVEQEELEALLGVALLATAGFGLLLAGATWLRRRQR